MRNIVTKRLVLVPAALEMLQAELGDPSRLANLLDAEVPTSWPPELFDRSAVEWSIDALERHPHHAGWYFHYFCLRATPERGRVLVGAGGYKGPPSGGDVEVGYAILPEFRRRGLAAEATAGLVRRAFASRDVERVIAHTLPDLIPSIGVLESCGFKFSGNGEEEGTIRYELARER